MNDKDLHGYYSSEQMAARSNSFWHEFGKSGGPPFPELPTFNGKFQHVDPSIKGPIYAWNIKCDAELNPPSVVEKNEVRARVTLTPIEINLDSIVKELKTIFNKSLISQLKPDEWLATFDGSFMSVITIADDYPISEWQPSNEKNITNTVDLIVDSKKVHFSSLPSGSMPVKFENAKELYEGKMVFYGGWRDEELKNTPRSVRTNWAISGPFTVLEK